ncbi:MAG: protein kinase [Lachnospiraceae bacterium]|nr:protein kinase [Lachnospiraceae bacterium]
MDIQAELPILCYAEIADINRERDVYLVQHIVTGKICVKKKKTVNDRKVYEQLKMGHFPGIPVIYDIYEKEGDTYILEEYITGESLGNMLERKGPFAPFAAAAIGVRICEILEPLHLSDPPLIQRDIKPENIIVTEALELYIVDFGAARIGGRRKKRDTHQLGTPGYAPPEQYGRTATEPASDVYAIGMLLIELLGYMEKKGSLRQLKALGRVIEKSTSVLMRDRYRDAGEMKRALLACLPVSPVNAWSKKEVCRELFREKEKERGSELCSVSRQRLRYFLLSMM